MKEKWESPIGVRNEERSEEEKVLKLKKMGLGLYTKTFAGSRRRRILDTPDFRRAELFHGNNYLPPVDEHKPHFPF
jgi:hypothetical protein